MSTRKEKFVALKAKQKKLGDSIKSQVEKFFVGESKKIFKKYPTLVSFSWTQYTPYFNDGEECVFSANTYLEYDDSVVFSDNQEVTEAIDDITELLSHFNNNDYKFMFGDHCKVIVTKDNVKVENYQHD